MGNYLTSPNSVKQSQNGALGRFRYGVCAMQGWRVSMEDSHLVHHFERLEPSNASAVLFGVYDGHGGPQVAQYVSRHLVEELLKNPDFRKGRFDAAFRAAYIALDALLSSEEAQSELAWFSQSQASRDSMELGSVTAPFPPISQTTSTEAAAAAAAKASSAPTPTTASNDTPQKTGFRSSVKLGGKMFHRRGDKRRKTEGESPGSPLHEPKEVGKEGASSSSDEFMDSFGSTIFSKLDGEVRSTDEVVSATLSDSVSSGGSAGSAIGNKREDSGEVDQVPHQATPLDATNANQIVPSTSPPQQPQQSPHSKNPQLGGVGSPNFFSLSGIRSLFTGMMKLGTSGRATQANQGLAMLAGCTAVSVLVTDKQVIVANAGDSRCVLCRGNVAVELSKDHKPQLAEERSRIYSAGGWLEMGRVNGNLNLSRALGDLIYKVNTSLPPDRQIVSAVPDVVFADLAEQDEFLIIGCDGIWESSTSQEIVDFIRERIDDAMQLSDVLEVLFEELLSPNPTLFEFGCDNMTAIIVDLHPDRRHPRLRSPRGTVSASASLEGRGIPSLTSAASTGNQQSASAHRPKPRGSQRVPNRHRGGASIPLSAQPGGAPSTSGPAASAAKQEPLFVDRESFWEGHDGSPYASDRSAPSTQPTVMGNEYPTWEGVVAAMSSGSPANPLIEKIAHPPKDTDEHTPAAPSATAASTTAAPTTAPSTSAASTTATPPTAADVPLNKFPLASLTSSPVETSHQNSPNPGPSVGSSSQGDTSNNATMNSCSPTTLSNPTPAAIDAPSNSSPVLLSSNTTPSTVSTSPSSLITPAANHKPSPDLPDSQPLPSETTTTVRSSSSSTLSTILPPLINAPSSTTSLVDESNPRVLRSTDSGKSFMRSTDGSDSIPVSLRRQISNAANESPAD